MRLAFRERPRKDVPRARRGLEPAGAPAAIEVQLPDGEGTDNRGRIRTDVDDPAPAAHHAQPAEDRKELEARGHLVLDDVERAALRVGVEAVDAGAHDELALVGLAHVD